MSIQPVKSGYGRPPKYPFREIGVGDSIFLPGTTSRRMHWVRAAYKPMRFRFKQVVRGGVQGVRVWRVE